jgi:hypothetical protein
MYLHVGNNKNIREKDIIGIFDMDNATISMITRKFLNECQKRDAIESASDEIPKSFVLYRDGEKVNICFSQLSSSSLYGRLSYTEK